MVFLPIYNKRKSHTYRAFKKSLSYVLSSLFLSGILIFTNPVFASAATDVDYKALLEERKSLPVQSNELAAWPIGPETGAEAAILMEADTGTILYAKNIHEKLYPASTTKMLTCLIAARNSTMDEMVTFSYEAVSSVPSDGSAMGIDAGESLPMSECLYGILVASANEVASAVGEHVGGSIDNFVDMMNETATELGCTETHFVNCNGLFDDNHYTSAHDLALIAKAFYENDTLRRIGNTPSYHFIATATQPDDFYKTNKHQLITGETPYEGIIGGKTGFTNEARQTLVTGCERNGMRLICVVLKEESPYQFTDTVSLFDYGYQNFTKVSVADNDKKYIINNSNFFSTGNDIFGNSEPFLGIDPEAYVVLPNMISFDELDSEITYDVTGDHQIAEISYSYYGTSVGSAFVLSNKASSSYEFTDHEIDTSSPSLTFEENTIFINIKMVLIFIAGLAGLFTIISIVVSMSNSRKDGKSERKRKRRMNRDVRTRKREERRLRRINKSRRKEWKKRR